MKKMTLMATFCLAVVILAACPNATPTASKEVEKPQESRPVLNGNVVTNESFAGEWVNIESIEEKKISTQLSISDDISSIVIRYLDKDTVEEYAIINSDWLFYINNYGEKFGLGIANSTEELQNGSLSLRNLSNPEIELYSYIRKCVYDEYMDRTNNTTNDDER